VTEPDPTPAAVLSYWTTQSKKLHWIARPTISLDLSPAGELATAPQDQQPRLTGGVLNLCFNAADRHVALGRAEDVAIRDGESELTFADLTEQTAQLAGVLRTLGLTTGDRVLSYLPRSTEAAVTLLACARLGVECLVIDQVTDPAALTEVLTAERPPVIVHSRADYGTTIARGLELSVHQPVRSIVVGPRVTAASLRGKAQDLAEWELDYRLLMRSSAIQPTECVPLPAAARLYSSFVGFVPGSGLLRREVATGEEALRLVATGASGEEADEALWPSTVIIKPLLLGRASEL
jgi:propionyl-CoA synthetase